MNTPAKQLLEEFNKMAIMNEMAMAWVDQQANKCCWVENPNTHENDYFKYLDSFSYLKADKVARISLREPVYLEHRNQDGKKNWKLSSKEKKELVTIMNKPSRVYKGCTNWQATIAQYNFDHYSIDPLDTIEDVYDKEKYPKAFSIDFPMPDYTQL